MLPDDRSSVIRISWSTLYVNDARCKYEENRSDNSSLTKTRRILIGVKPYPAKVENMVR